MFTFDRFRVGFACLGLFLTISSLAEEPQKKGEPPPSRPEFVAVTDVAGLPRVLLIGDSISIGYTLPVRRLLSGQANVHRPAENCGDTARGVESLDRWLGSGTWDVIHFNFGLHDLKYLDAAGKYVAPDQGKQVASPEQYAANLRKIIRRLKTTGARLVFATTTPVPAGTRGRVQGDEQRYNEAALRVMRELHVEIDDLHAVVEQGPAGLQLPKNVHFSDEGYERLAQNVVACLRPLLPAATSLRR